MKIAVIGGGAIGSYYAGLLSRAGTSVRLITRGEHLSAVRAHGLEIRTPEERFVTPVQATGDGAAAANSDFVVVAVKGYSLGDIAPALVTASRSGAAILPLLNGVDVAERIETFGVPRQSIIGGLASVSVFRTAPGVIERRSPFDSIVLGELDRVPRDRSAWLADALTQAGTSARVSDDISHDLWRKFAFIVPMTVVCGLSRRPAGASLERERGRALFSGALAEIVAISRATGAALDDEDARRIEVNLLALPPGMRPSFLADLERGGPTELDLLAGAVSRLGRRVGIPTPIHDVATAAFEAATAPE